MLKNIELIKQLEYYLPIRHYFEIVTKKINVHAVLLFGSVARGDAKPFRSYESDIDLIVVIKELPQDLGKRLLYKLDVESGTRSRVQSILKWGRSWNIKAGEVVEL